MKAKIEVKAYPITYKNSEFGNENWASYIGVCKDGWHDAILDSAIDAKCYYFMDEDEFQKAEVGDNLDGECIIKSIAKEPEFSETITYNEEDFV
jgi:hypothetical protein